jgi:N-(2-amino-2-carboxyethyl)-L-glutamate synthase
MILDHPYDIITDHIYLRLADLLPGVEPILKVEGLNVAGSIKLKTAVSLVEDAERRRVLRPGGRIIESSSGNLGVALSSVCASKGYAFTCVTDPNASANNVAVMRAYGAEVVMVDRRDANGGYLSTRLELIQQRLRDDPVLVWLNQYANQANPRAHYIRTAAAIVADLDPVDYLFVGAGTTGTLNGCADYFRRYSGHTRIIAVDAVGSVTFGFPPGRRLVPGIGTSNRPDMLRPDVADEVVLVAESDAICMCRRLARQHGILVGGSTGSVLAAVEAKAADLRRGARVVAISPDLGERYLSTIYDDGWVARNYRLDASARPDVAGVYAYRAG